MPLFLFIFDFITYIHSFNHYTFIRRHSLKLLSISSSLVCSVGKTSLCCRESNSGLPYSKPTRCQLSHTAPLPSTHYIITLTIIIAVWPMVVRFWSQKRLEFVRQSSSKWRANSKLTKQKPFLITYFWKHRHLSYSGRILILNRYSKLRGNSH